MAKSIGVVTRVTEDGIVYVWTTKSKLELLIDERDKPPRSRLALGDWLDFEASNLDLITVYRKIESRLESKTDAKNRLLVKTQIMFLNKEKGGSDNFIIANSVDFGRVGCFRTFPESSFGQRYYCWVMRIPQSQEHLGNEFNVQWCLSEEQMLQAFPDVCNVSSECVREEVAPIVKPQPKLMDSIERLTGLVVSISAQKNFAYVWTPSLGEGIVPDAREEKLNVADWLQFTFEKAKAGQVHKFVVLQFWRIAPMFPASRIRNTVQAKVEVTVSGAQPFRKPSISAEFFGEIEDDDGYIKNAGIQNSGSLAVTIYRRKPYTFGGSIWSIKSMERPLSSTSPSFARNALDKMMMSKETQESVRAVDPSALEDALKYLGKR